MTYQKKQEKKTNTLVTFFQQYKVDLETLLVKKQKDKILGFALVSLF